MFPTGFFPIYYDICVYRVFGNTSVRYTLWQKSIITLRLRRKKNRWKIYGSRCDEDTVDLHSMVFYTTHVNNPDGSTCVLFRPKLLYTPGFSGGQLIMGVSKIVLFLFPNYVSLFVSRYLYVDVSLTFRVCHWNKSPRLSRVSTPKFNGSLKTKGLEFFCLSRRSNGFVLRV